jgi:MFS family permease
MDELGCVKMCLGMMTSCRSALQLVGAPALGRFSDRFGRKPAFAVACAGNVASLVIFGSASSVQGLFFSTVPSALLSDRFGVLKAVVADHTPEETADQVAVTTARAGMLGKLGAATGVGLVLGPMVGSKVLANRQQAACVGVLANILVLLVVAFLPPPPPPREPAAAAAAAAAPREAGVSLSPPHAVEPEEEEEEEEEEPWEEAEPELKTTEVSDSAVPVARVAL